jgi:single-strand DNA-binding protein
MAVSNQMMIVGNLTADPEIRQVKGDKSVVSLTIATTPRAFNRDTKEWEDGEALFVRCSAWDEFAQNIAASLTKGTRVFATGVMKSRKYDKDGETKTAQELQIDEIGPSLRYAQAQVRKPNKGPVSAPKPDSDGWVTVDDDTPF